MPTVPRYNESQVQPNARPNVQRSADLPLDTFGGGQSSERVNQAVQGVADLGTRIAQEEKAKADQLSVLEADRQLSALETDIQYNTKTGAMKREGRDAFGLSDEVQTKWSKGIEEIQKGLHNDTQRMAFKQSEQSRWGSLNKNIQAHVSTQIGKYDAEVTESSLANERDAASLNYMDPERINLSLERQKGWIIDHANRNGLPAEWIERKTADAMSKTALSVLDRMLANGQDQLAKQSYDNYKHMLTGKDATDAEKALKEGMLRGESQRTTDSLMQSYGTWAERLNAAKEIEDPATRDEVDRRLKTNMATEKAVKQQTEEETIINATNIIEQTKDFYSVPPSMLRGLTPSARTSLRNYAEQVAAGVKVPPGGDEFYNLKRMAATPETREDFLTTNITALKGQMAPQEYKELFDLQIEMRNGKGEEKLGEIRTKAQIINSTIAGIGIDPTPKKKADQQRVNKIWDLVETQLKEVAKTKKINNDDVQAAIDRVIEKGEIPGWKGYFTRDKYVFDLAPGEAIMGESKEQITYGGIPALDRQQITEALQAANRPVTDEAVLSLYLMRVRNADK